MNQCSLSQEASLGARLARTLALLELFVAGLRG
jgi:hypothetical protein